MAEPSDTHRLNDPLNETKQLPVLALPSDPTEEFALPAERVRAPRAPRPGRRPGGRGRRLAVGLLLAALGIGIGVGASVVLNHRSSGSGAAGTAASGADAGAVVTPVAVTGLDAKAGGSGFAKSGSGWRTQTYTTAAFGGLKSGVGLVLDLGAARSIASVSLDVGGSPLTVALRSADDKPTGDSGMTPVGAAKTASGTVVLDAAGGGEHRYWIVWVTALGQRDGGFGATVSTPVVKG